MALPPRSLGARLHPVQLERVDERHWRVTVNGHPLPGAFGSDDDAREAGSAEVVRLDALALALLRRTRSRLRRKQR